MSLALYFERIDMLRNIIVHIIRLAGGGFVPVDFISNNIRYTFIYYSIGVYPDVILGNFDPLLILVWVGWGLLLGAIGMATYKKAIRHLSINGG
jgi:hypothetical protein